MLSTFEQLGQGHNLRHVVPTESFFVWDFRVLEGCLVVGQLAGYYLRFLNKLFCLLHPQLVNGWFVHPDELAAVV